MESAPSVSCWKSRGISLDEPEHTTDEPLSASPAVPRFGIMDMLVLTAAMSLVFALREKFEMAGWSYRTDVQWFRTTEHIVFCLTYALPLAAVFRFVINKRRMGRFLFEPGHWILFASFPATKELQGTQSFLVFFGNALSVLALLFFNGMTDGYITGDNSFWYFVPSAIFSLLSSCVLIRGAFFFRKAWMLMLLLLATTEVCKATQSLLLYSSFGYFFGSPSTYINWILSCLGWASTVMYVLVCVGLILLMLKEGFRGPKRDFWHWIGLFLPLLSCFIYPVIGWIYARYIFDPALYP